MNLNDTFKDEFLDTFKEPYVSMELVEYMKGIFDYQQLIRSKQFTSAEEHIGYLKGINDVLVKLESMTKGGIKGQ